MLILFNLLNKLYLNDKTTFFFIHIAFFYLIEIENYHIFIIILFLLFSTCVLMYKFISISIERNTFRTLDNVILCSNSKRVQMMAANLIGMTVDFMSCESLF